MIAVLSMCLQRASNAIDKNVSHVCVLPKKTGMILRKGIWNLCVLLAKRNGS